MRQWLADDESAPRKQRHTARRIYDRLVAEHGFPGAEVTVRQGRLFLKTVFDFLNTYLASWLAQRLRMKKVPELRFYLDTTLEEGNKMEAILHEIEKERASRPVDPEEREG